MTPAPHTRLVISSAAELRALCAAKLEPRWVPGEKAGYHMASSWFALGEVIRRVDGRPFPEYVRAEIFEPLGMDDCWVGMPPERYRRYVEEARLASLWNTEMPKARSRKPMVKKRCGPLGFVPGARRAFTSLVSVGVGLGKASK